MEVISAKKELEPEGYGSYSGGGGGESGSSAYEQH
jgi:hypothetical protein